MKLQNPRIGLEQELNGSKMSWGRCLFLWGKKRGAQYAQIICNTIIDTANNTNWGTSIIITNMPINRAEKLRRSPAVFRQMTDLGIKPLADLLIPRGGKETEPFQFTFDGFLKGHLFKTRA